MEKVYVPKSPKEKAMQRALLQYRKPSNYKLVYEALTLAGREDLIGYGPKCLIRPPGRPKGDKGAKAGVKPGKKAGNRSKEKPSFGGTQREPKGRTVTRGAASKRSG